MTIGLLVSIHPLLALLAVFAIPTVVTSSWRPGVERVVEEHGAQYDRRAKHLFTTATIAAAGKEVRVTGIGPRLVAQRREAWEAWYGPVAAARTASAVWHTLAWAVFGGAYVGAIVFVASGLDASVGEVLLVLAAGSRLSAYIGATVGEIGFLRGIWLDGSRRLAWLEEYVASLSVSADVEVPSVLAEGIRFEDVSFAYPGTSRLVLENVNVSLPAGAVIAIVGENGAGKSTLVKLLCKLYEPTSGAILVDGLPLTRMAPDSWRARLAGAFQDFFRFEFRAQHSVGVGDLLRLDDTAAVSSAVDRAGASDVISRLEDGLETQLGPTWPEGVELSFGQWQKLALARGFMRDDALLLVLDEPTAALDAETEHALFERYAAAARSLDGAGRITILVSHRFSTVRMADLIVVLDGARVVEVGTHEELIAGGRPVLRAVRHPGRGLQVELRPDREVVRVAGLTTSPSREWTGGVVRRWSIWNTGRWDGHVGPRTASRHRGTTKRATHLHMLKSPISSAGVVGSGSTGRSRQRRSGEKCSRCGKWEVQTVSFSPSTSTSAVITVRSLGSNRNASRQCSVTGPRGMRVSSAWPQSPVPPGSPARPTMWQPGLMTARAVHVWWSS